MGVVGLLVRCRICTALAAARRRTEVGSRMHHLNEFGQSGGRQMDARIARRGIRNSGETVLQ